MESSCGHWHPLSFDRPARRPSRQADSCCSEHSDQERQLDSEGLGLADVGRVVEGTLVHRGRPSLSPLDKRDFLACLALVAVVTWRPLAKTKGKGIDYFRELNKSGPLN